MAMWQCNRCGASFPDHHTQELHWSEVHGDHIRGEEPRVPHASPVKPLGPGTARDAQDIRTGVGREMRSTHEGPEPHPTGMTKNVARVKRGPVNPPPSSTRRE